MGGGGLIEMLVTACSLVGVMRVISRIDHVAPAVIAPSPPNAAEEEAKTKIKFDLPPSTTPVKAASTAGGDVSQVETPSWLDRDASALSTGEDGANDTTVQLDYLTKSPVSAAMAPPPATAAVAPPTVDFPSLLLKSSAASALRPQLVPTPSWLVPNANQQQPSATLNNGRLGSPSWMSNKRNQAQTRALKSRATSE
ncbi:hypothetical protein BASA81_003109 [Batrachochytrium salamandrivorans]|nr:hypothetical protein BASA81_003109 [Batrachochytrium salamandrivorans]